MGTNIHTHTHKKKKKRKQIKCFRPEQNIPSSYFQMIEWPEKSN